MGSFTTIYYQGKERQVIKGHLHIWLYLVAISPYQPSSTEDWELEARQMWRRNAVEAWGVTPIPDLDYIITTEERRQRLLEICAAERKKLSQQKLFTKEWLNEHISSQGIFWGGNIPAKDVLKVADAFISVLEKKDDKETA